jgi:drug/metabolite transporter (DMT)-like permease
LLAIPLFAERPGAWQYSGAVLVIAATGLVAGGSRHPGAA